MFACALQASKAPTPKPHDALSCPQHALPTHAPHGVCTPGRGSGPEITVTIPSFPTWRPTALESSDSTENPHGALGTFSFGHPGITPWALACFTSALAVLTSSRQGLSNDMRAGPTRGVLAELCRILAVHEKRHCHHGVNSYLHQHHLVHCARVKPNGHV